MIAKDQPTIFPENVQIVFSSVSDGSIAAGAGNPPQATHLRNRTKLLTQNNFPEENTSILFITYANDQTYNDTVEVTDDNIGSVIPSDALYTYKTNAPLYLPVADCIATVVYDAETRMLGLLHLGRHASIAGLIEKFAQKVGGNPKSWLVWMSPSIQKQSNKLHYFDLANTDEWKPFTTQTEGGYLVDLPAHNRQTFINLGVEPKNIEVSQVDTFTDKNYYSHRAAIELDKPERQGRMAVVAMVR